MSRSKHGSKGPGYDFWGKRAKSGTCGHGRWVKKQTTRIERSRLKQELNRGDEDLKKREAI